MHVPALKGFNSLIVVQKTLNCNWLLGQLLTEGQKQQVPPAVSQCPPTCAHAFSRCLPDAVRRSKLFAGVRGAMGCLCAAREAKLRERAATESPSPVASSSLVVVVSAAAHNQQLSSVGCSREAGKALARCERIFAAGCACLCGGRGKFA